MQFYEKKSFFFFQSEQEKLHLLSSLYSSPDQQDLLFSSLCQKTFRYDTNYKSDVILKMHFTYPSHLTLPQTNPAHI